LRTILDAAKNKERQKEMKTLINCKACAREISPNAASCPHCGEKLKVEQSATGLLAAIIIALIIGGFLYAVIGGL
jgi:uncharacterized OB-fold protein